jgi:RNA 2',3'-cyclic 3'-phosphodiesterase
MMRTFLALPVPDNVRAHLSVQQFLLPLPNTVPPESFHITLAYLGEVPDAVLEGVHDNLLGLRFGTFDLHLHGLGHFGHAKPHTVYASVMPSDPLMRLQAKVATMARAAGAVIPAARYVPHVTLGRFRTPAPDIVMRLERAIAESGAFRTEPFAVPEVVLYQSFPGPRYDALAAYPLTP